MARVIRPSRRASVVRYERQLLIWRIGRTILDTLLTIILLVCIAGSVFLLYKRLTQDAFFPLKRVMLERPLVYANSKNITDTVQAFGRADLLHIDVRKLADELRRLDWVKSAKVNKEWPDALRVDVQERLPVLRWGKEGFLDTEGIPFTLTDNSALETLFPVTGPQGSEQDILQMYRIIHPWLREQGVRMAGLQLDNRKTWHIRLENDIDVVLGKDNLNQNLKKLAVMQRKITQEYARYIESIDLRYQNGFSVRWKDGVKPSEVTEE